MQLLRALSSVGSVHLVYIERVGERISYYQKAKKSYLFFYNTSHYFCKLDLSRGLSAAVLQEKAIQFDFIGKKNAVVKAAFKSALLDANQQDIISVGGSAFVVAEIN